QRALPDVRDGLKPVQRRTLYDMHILGIKSDKPYRKSARIVGDTMGKFHPHGDSSIYESLVVMDQDFKKGMTLVDGHGNFGSIEGDGAAAMRYTEARLQKVTEEAFLKDLDKDVIDFIPNFDETEREPSVLPVRVPNLLINGSEGIAVGMATSIPPHNLGETIDAVKAYMDDSTITTEELMKYIPGPDFPTGGIVINKDELLNIYETGQGKIRLRGKVEYEKAKGGREYLVITEIPYTMIGANIGKFLNDVYSLVETKKTQDIIDISNQSSEGNMRIVLELRRNADVEKLKNLLYKKTRLEDTFGVNMLAVAGGRPETMSLKEIIEAFLDFQYDITTRKYQTLLNKELDRMEIQEGLIKACDVIDLIIEILRGSKNREQAKNCLVNGETEAIKIKTKKSRIEAALLHFTERQAKAIMEMQLYKLIGLEILALQKEYEETKKNIETYRNILDNYEVMSDVIAKDLDAVKKEFSRPRRTLIENAEEAVYVEEKAPEMPVVFAMDRFGYVRSFDTQTYERNKEAADSESKYIFTCSNMDRICMFTDTGNMHTLRMQDVPFGKFRGKAVPADTISNIDTTKETVLLAAPLSVIKNAGIVFITSDGLAKLVKGEEFDVAKRTIASTKLNDNEALAAVCAVGNETQVVMITRGGMFLRFALSEVPEKKRAALGVRAIRLAETDSVESAYLVNPSGGTSVEYGGQAVPVSRIKLMKRDNKGTKLKL
ncbi:MAG: DNA topoisomerase 4 subunit A, partial [Lachnospiraceae bacterium]|nr:DNA topoisomerase 4 subunit A [Lachnospiraceae bacterium]